MSMTEVVRHVTRDAFPSGHADIALLSIVLAFQFRVKIRWVIGVIGVSLIIATVYLRYHYVIDLIGGGVLAVITMYTWQWVRDGMLALQKRLLRE
jgi:membrane-associated phospholipid phosphatase